MSRDGTVVVPTLSVAPDAPPVGRVRFWFGEDGILRSINSDSVIVVHSSDAGGVTSVNGQTGIVVLDKTDVGLGNVDNTSDVDKPVSTAQATAISDSITTHEAALDPHPQYTTAAEAAAAAPVQSVNSQTGIVVLTKTDVGLGNVDNTSDVDKPVSTAQATAISSAITTHESALDPHPQYTTSAEAAAAAPVQSVNGQTGIVVLDKTSVGLANVDNTSDLNKPISTATQAALDLKADDSDLTAHVTDPTDAHAASAVTNTPAGNLAATDVQGALNELQSDVDTRATSSALTTHEGLSIAHGVTGTLVGTSDSQSLTNKTIDADLNTISNIDNADIKAAAGIVDTKLDTISTPGKVLNSATTATSANTASAIVARDASGNFAAGEISLFSGTTKQFDVGMETFEAASTGVESFAGFTITGGNTTFTIGAGEGHVVDHVTDTYSSVTWSAITGQSPATSSGVTWVYMDRTGTPSITTSSPTPTLVRDYILLGRVITVAGLITVARSIPSTILYPTNAVFDLASSIGPFNVSGNVLSANGANLNVNKTAGIIYTQYANFAASIKDPSQLSIASGTPMTFQYVTQLNGSNSADTTAVVPGSYDVAGTVTAIAGSSNQATNQYIYVFANGSILIQYGQTVYSTLSAAIAAIGTETRVVYPSAPGNGVLIGVLSVTKGATALNDAANARFSAVSRFGDSAVGGSGATNTTLQQAYNNNTSEPEILTDSTRGAVSLRRGSAADTDTVLSVENGAGTSNASIAGTGLISTSQNLMVRNRELMFKSLESTSTLAVRAVTTWATKVSAADNQWRAVCWSPELGIFAAVALTGTANRVMTSSDGITWIPRTSAADNQWNSICWSAGRGIFVAVSNTGTGNRVMTSPDGINWTTRTSAADNQWNSVCRSSELDLFVAVAGTGTANRVMTSSDGITWTSRTSAADNTWTAICWSPELGLFAAVSASGTGNRVMTSPDGITWTARTSAADNTWFGVCWSPELRIFVAVSATGTGNRVMTSSDGITWTARTSAADNDWRGVCWSAEFGLFVAVAITGTANGAMTSPDGITWTARNPGADIEWRGVAWSPELGTFAAVASTGTGNRVTTTLDVGHYAPRKVVPKYFYKTAQASEAVKTVSKFYTRTNSIDNDWYGVCWSPELNLFAAVAAITGTGNRVMTSPDGINWTTRTSAADNNWASICWAPELGLFCAVAASGTTNRVMTSPDGVTWTARTSGANAWRSVCWSPELSLFAAVSSTGTGDRVMTSPDGITWTTRTTVDNDWRGICWSPKVGLFVAVVLSGTANRVMTSPNGVTWTTRTPAVDLQWISVCWSPALSLFAAVAITGTSNRIMTSPDGITWTTRTNPVDNWWYSVCWSPELGLFMAVSSTGTGDRVMTSPDGINWTTRTSAADNDWRAVCWSPELNIFVAVGSTGTGTRVMTSRRANLLSEILNLDASRAR
jgi:hypothetical protein